jgi:hypothetical protein
MQTLSYSFVLRIQLHHRQSLQRHMKDERFSSLMLQFRFHALPQWWRDDFGAVMKIRYTITPAETWLDLTDEEKEDLAMAVFRYFKK